MVIGHTPNFTISGKGITTACQKKSTGGIIRVDVGTSRAFDKFSGKDPESLRSREPQVVEILTNLITKESSVRILR
jgi:hypothetical protein